MDASLACFLHLFRGPNAVYCTAFFLCLSVHCNLLLSAPGRVALIPYYIKYSLIRLLILRADLSLGFDLWCLASFALRTTQ